MQRSTTLAIGSNANAAQSDGRKLMEDFHHYKGIILRGWRFIVICMLASLTAAVIYIATVKPTYKATSRLLVIQQSGRPIHVGGGGNDQLASELQSDDNLATHVLLLKSPVIIEQAFTLKGLKAIPLGAVMGNLTVKQPDTNAKMIDLVFKSKSPHEAQLVLDGIIESYKLFLKSNYQQNSSGVIGLITKARQELSDELKALEKAYMDYRQKNPTFAADSTGQSFVVRRLDLWDQALNQFSARALQLQSQLELGKKMSRNGVDPTSIASTLTQAGTLGGNLPFGSTAPMSSATNVSTNDGSYVGIARDLVDVESRRRLAEVYLAHLQRENQESGATREVSERDIETRFRDDPAVADLVLKIRRVEEQLADTKRLARGSDPALRHSREIAEDLKQQYQQLWVAKRPLIVESLASESNPDLKAGYRAAEAELITLKARESALRERLDQVATEEHQKLLLQHEKLRREHGESHPLVAKLKERIAGIETRQKQSADSPAGGNVGTLIDYMTQNLESIESLRGDLEKKFAEDLKLSKQAEITLLEESNLRSNLERQRALFFSVVDQLKQAHLVSDFDSVSTQTVAPVTVAADQTLAIPLLILATMVGAGLGSGAAFLADLLEARVRTLAEIRKLVDVPLIGVIPFIRDNQIVSEGTAGLLSHQKPRSALAESYKTTRTNLEFLRRSRQAHVLLVASSLPGDGKTTTASNLAITLANTGRRTLLIDGDLRKASLHRLFDVSREGGFSDALLGKESIDRLVQPTFVNNLDLLTTGHDVPNPAELLASERLGEVINELRTMYDMVLIDSSPLLLVTDPSIIAAVADGIILVVKISSTRRHDLDVTNDMLKTLGVPVFGMVINGVTRDEVGYGYGYGYGYGGYGYGGYGGYGAYGRKNVSPYGPSDEPPANVNGSLPQDWKPSVSDNGKLGHENGATNSI
jgi:capsular exopolysaccharide synthesis family protein